MPLPLIGHRQLYKVFDRFNRRRLFTAYEVGYRSIDTAQAYGNEEGVGSAVKKSGIAREEFFITTKIWISNAGYEKAKASIEQSLQKLQSDYIDLLLIHQPFNDYYGTYRAMEEAYKNGMVKAIGVSNFYPDCYIDLATFCEVKPAVNQVETHVFQQQKQAREYMEKFGTQIMSWGPFAEGKNDYFNNATLKEVGEKNDKTVAQTALRFLIQSGVVVIPKSTHKERMAENFKVLDFALDDNDMKKITSLDTGKSLFFSHQDPETVEWFMGMFK